ncbi:MAG TPA: hypothetical protein ENJ95_22530 [Bacteroidetes bacterium]|nr:hypothetical protein [Bacteroidota bacterium]
MKEITLVSILTLAILITSCKKEEPINATDYLINEKGWYSYEAKRTDLIDGTGFTTDSPYIILGEYGSGFRLNSDGFCFITYADGSSPIEEESTIKRNWQLISDNKIEFKDDTQSSKDITAIITKINYDSLWIEYEQAGDLWEYKLKKIE